MITGSGVPAGMALAHHEELRADPALERVSLEDLQHKYSEPLPPDYCLIWLPEKQASQAGE